MVFSALSISQAASIDLDVIGTFTINGAGSPNLGADLSVIAGSSITYDDATMTLTGINLILSSGAKANDTLTTAHQFDAPEANSVTLGAGTVTLSGGAGTFGYNNGLSSFTFFGAPTLAHNDVGNTGGASNVHNGAGGLTLTVVPEPHEYAMMAGLGLLGFGVWRRKIMQMA